MPLFPGDRLGPYEVGPLLGAGGMGEVYRARDPRLGRDVAIKVLRGDFSLDPDRLRRFEQEARAAAALNHPNILVVHDIGTHDGQPFVVSEVLEGETLREKMGRGPLPVRKAVEYAIQIAHGLAAGHAKGIVHRDVKPANLFVTQGGRLKILDFGLAKLVAIGDAARERSSAPTTTLSTHAGQIVGTSAYMSPEQVRGEEVDHRSDIFAFGSVLYEMLTGKRAFDRPTPIETMSAALNEEPPGIRDATDLPADLVLTLRRCLEKDRDDRFQSARDLAFQLTLLEPGASSRANVRPPGTRRSPIGRRGVAIALAAVLAVLAAFAAGMRAGRTPLPIFQQLTFRRGEILSARFTPDGHTVVYGAAWDGKPFQLSSTRLGSTDSRLLALSDGDILAISSSGEMAISLGRRYAVGYAARGTLARLPLDAGSPREVLPDVEQADWSPDGRSLAAARFAGGKYRLEFPLGTVLYETAGWISRVRVSPDGSRVAFTDHPVYGDDRGSVCVMPRSGGGRRVLSDGWSSVSGLAWSTDGKEIWFTAADVGATASLRAVDLSGRTRMILPAAGRLTLQDIDRAGRVLVAQSRFRLRIGAIDVRGGKERELSWLDGSVATDLSSDGSTLLFAEQGAGSGTSAYAVYVRKTDGAPPTRIGEGSVAALSPDGTWAAAVVLGGSPSIVLLPTSVGESRVLPRGTLVDYEAVTWFPDGRRLLVTAREADRRVRLWEQDVSGGVPKPMSAEGLRVAFSSRPISPDGRHAAALDEDDRVWLQGLNGGAPERLDALNPGDIPIRWDADGASLYVYRRGELPAVVHRYRLRDRVKQPVAALAPADRVGVSALVTVHTTPDARTFFYTYSQTLSDLFVVSHLR